MRIAVAGGTGTVGRHVVEVARERGHDPVVLSRSTGVDLTTGEGLDAELAGSDVVVDVTSVATTKTAVAIDFFGTVTRRLLGAERRLGIAHHVTLSIVGIDRRGEPSGVLRRQGRPGARRGDGRGALDPPAGDPIP